MLLFDESVDIHQVSTSDAWMVLQNKKELDIYEKKEGTGYLGMLS